MAQRREQAADPAEAERQLVPARQDKARIDPVTPRVAQVFALSRNGVDLAIALLFGLLLECVACLGWLQGLPRRAATPVIESHDDKVTRGSSSDIGSSKFVTGTGHAGDTTRFAHPSPTR